MASTLPCNSYSAIRFYGGLAWRTHPAASRTLEREGHDRPTKGRQPAWPPVLARTRQPTRRSHAGGQPRRADAKRNVAAILTAAAECLAKNPDTSVAEIAAAAGVGRMTLYGHFKTRADLLDAVLTRVIAEADETLDAVDVSGDPRDALARLVAASWLVVDRLRHVLEAAQRELPAERIRQAHDRVLGRVQSLIERGRDAGAFRADLPLPWLVSLAMNVMHAAATEVSAGRLTSDQAPSVVAGTLLAALTAPGDRGPRPARLRRTRISPNGSRLTPPASKQALGRVGVTEAGGLLHVPRERAGAVGPAAVAADVQRLRAGLQHRGRAAAPQAVAAVAAASAR